MTYPTGRPLSHAIHRVDLAGVDVDQYLAKFLIGRGHDFIQTGEHAQRDVWFSVLECFKDRRRDTAIGPLSSDVINPFYLTI